MKNSIKLFFAQSDILDYMVLRQLSHVNLGWELTWDPLKREYEREEGTFAGLFIDLIDELAITQPPHKYHDNEDTLAEYVKESLHWPIQKIGNKWIGMKYRLILEQGGFKDINEKNLVQAASGRIKAAINHGQRHFDDMEQSHQKILADVLTIILYHRMGNMEIEF